MTNNTESIAGLRPGDQVRVKSPEAILATLDERGRLDNMPFMPEMFDACGRTFSVYARADKTCDTATQTRGRRLSDSVHLTGERCDGSAHGGCQAECLNFWKSAWLERSDADADDIAYPAEQIGMARERLDAFTSTNDDGTTVYSCQATELPNYTTLLKGSEIGQYWDDFTKNGIGLGRMLRVFFNAAYHRLVRSGVGYRFWVSLYNGMSKMLGGHPWPYRPGPHEKKTPTGSLDLQVGEHVRVKSLDEIVATLNKEGKNRGMSFDAEMVRYCGKVFRVHSRVDRLINEGTGVMIDIQNPCIILEDVWCSSDWSACRRFCPRSIYHYWRELWLERVDDSGASKAA
ncbi:MAG: hypothetical protein AAFX10_02910 [Pseudomonadota bacterium]